MDQDYVHMLIQISPEYSDVEMVGYLKGKSATSVVRQFPDRNSWMGKGLMVTVNPNYTTKL